MLHSNIQFIKEKGNKDATNELVLLKLKPHTEQVEHNQKHVPLNISICIDVSGSMGSQIGNHLINHFQNNSIFGANPNKETPIKNTSTKNKMELAKDAAIKAVELMKDGDIVSIVTFSDQIRTVVDPIEINTSNKNLIINNIKSINCGGMTNLYDGWLKSCEHIANNLDKNKVNRVLLISDGDITAGIRDNNKIFIGVEKVSSQGISTSTFGVGNDFAEDLMIGMSNSGDGNSYYVEKNEDLEEFFLNEYNGVKNILGKNVKIEPKFKSINKIFNKYKEKNGKIELPNLINDKEISLLIDIEKNDIHNLGEFILSYENNKGKVIKEIISVTQKESVPFEEWEKLPDIQEVASEKALLEIAEVTYKAVSMVDNGDFEGAKGILRQTREHVMSLGFESTVLTNEVNKIESTISSYENTRNASVLRKDLSYQGYMASTSRLDK